MSNSTFSSSWHRVAELKPTLRSHADILRHKYRKQLVYILQDHAGGRYHKFNRSAYEIIGRLDGKRTVTDIWKEINEALGDDAPTQDEVIQTLSKLHSADLLQSNSLPDCEEIFSRYEEKRAAKLKQPLLNPLALKFSICDPDQFLIKLLPLARKLFSKFSAAIWACTIFLGALLAIMNASQLTANFDGRLFEPFNLLLLILAYPFVKVLHEMGHALATRHWGGEVHEIGVTIMVFMPVPFVDATAAWAFPEKSKRMLVSAMGIMVELFLASIALFVWLNVQPGIVSSIAFNVMLIGGVSTLFFNGNPLLRFDGYYVFQDALEIPNLSARSNQYIAYIVKRYLFGLKNAISPVNTSGERRWFVTYSIASFMYRMFILFFIALLIAKKFLVIGVMLVALVMFIQIIKPLYKQINYLFSNSELQLQRPRAITISGAVLASTLVIIFMFPVPNLTRAEGVIWPSHNSQVRTEVDGFVQELLVVAGQKVEQGQPIIRLENIYLHTEEKITKARIQEINAHYSSIVLENYAEAKIMQEELAFLKAELKSIQTQLANLIIKSTADGYFSLVDDKEINGLFIEKGTLVANIVDHHRTTALVAVSQRDVGLVRQSVNEVDVRLAQQISDIHRAEISREIPAASNKLPSKALGVMGGGNITVDDSDGLTSREPVFLFELTLSEKVKTNFGERVYVRFDHGHEPLAAQWYRASRQLFLRNFNV